MEYDRNTYYMYENLLGDEDIIVHKIGMPDNIKGGWYWQISSIESFYRRMTTEFADNHYSQQTGLYIRFHRECTALDLPDSHYKLFNYERPCYSVVTHDTVWEFYKAIGYDHKKRSVKKFMIRR